MAIASGLEMGGKDDAVDLRTDLFLEWLTGQVGGVEVGESSSTHPTFSYLLYDFPHRTGKGFHGYRE